VEAESRLSNLQEVIGSMVEFERTAPEPSLAAFLELVTLQTDVDRIDESDAITLMTVHAAKGLEYPVVIVSGLEEETFPSRRRDSEDEFEDLEEERRLAYVAFTRAQSRLFLSYAQSRRVYGELMPRTRSRFLDEMPAEELQLVGTPGRARRIGPGRFATYHAPSTPPRPAPAPAAYTDSYVDSSESDGQPLRRGTLVRHRAFGVGQVLAVIPASPPRVQVLFRDVGEKRVLTSHLEPA
jgi:DNA helicase-2/ATP-dependent DNA helicase PcrA